MKKILIIDGDPKGSSKAGQMLLKKGFSVISVKNYNNALEIVTEQQPDLILCEFASTNTRGRETVQELRGNPTTSAIPLIIMAARAGKDEQRKWMSLGFDDFMNTSAPPEEMLSAIEARLARYNELIRPYTEKLNQAEINLKNIARYDDVTGFLNRDMIPELIQDAVHSVRSGHRLGIMMLELERLHFIFEVQGWEAGNELIRKIARRLYNCLIEKDQIFRMSRSKFIILLLDVQNKENASSIVRRILKTIERPIYLNGYSLNITGRVGVSIYPDDTDDWQLLLSQAEVAHNNACTEGCSLQFYSENLEEQANDHFELESSFNHALSPDEFREYFISTRLKIRKRKQIAS